MGEKLEGTEAWMLREASKPGGFCPHALSVKEEAVHLETRGWLERQRNAPVWVITPAGRAALASKDQP